MAKRTGKTTRIIDRCVQELFNKGKTYLYCETRDRESTKTVMKIFIKRMQSEHNHVEFAFNSTRESGIHCFKIELING